MQNEGEKTEYRMWNPFRSKLAAAVLAGLDNIYIKPGMKVLYLGAASGTSVSHCSDIVGPEGAPLTHHWTAIAPGRTAVPIRRESAPGNRSVCCHANLLRARVDQRPSSALCGPKMWCGIC